MAIFVTGSTGYLGSYLSAGLLTGYRDKLNLLIRGKTEQEARERLWTPEKEMQGSGAKSSTIWTPGSPEPAER